MMRMALLVLLAGATLRATPSQEAERGFHAQRAAWNHGDLEAALAYYLDDASMTWVNRASISFGRRDFAAAMRADFGGRPSEMGVYSGEVLQKRDLTDHSALIVVRWAITKDGKRLFGGVSTQLWEGQQSGWRIVFEHAS